MRLSRTARLRDRAVDRLRAIWNQVEAACLDAAAPGGDLELAVQRAFEKQWKQAAADIEDIGAVVCDVLAGAILSSAGAVMGAVLGQAGTLGLVAVSGAMSTRRVLKRRRARAWISLQARLDKLTGNG